MALIACPECAREISDTIKACPHCGFAIALNVGIEASPQQVEVTAINLANTARIKKAVIIITAVIAVIAVVVGVVLAIRNNNAEKERIAAENERIALRQEYIENTKEIHLLMLNGAVDAEQVGNMARSVWRNTIYKTDDSTTNLFTKTGGSFNEDFNVSLRAMYDNSITVEWVEKIRVNQDEVAQLYKLLQNPPEEFSSLFTALDNTYSAYTGLTRLAISPSGTLVSFSDDFRKFDTEFLEGYNKLELLIPDE